MPSRSLTTSTQGPAMRSGGVSLPSFTNTLVQCNWTDSPNSVEILTVDRGFMGGGEVRTTVELTADSVAELSPDIAARFWCFYVLAHLKGPWIQEASEILRDVYGHQIRKLETAPVPSPAPYRVKMQPKIRTVERQPFNITE